MLTFTEQPPVPDLQLMRLSTPVVVFLSTPAFFRKSSLSILFKTFFIVEKKKILQYMHSLVKKIFD